MICSGRSYFRLDSAVRMGKKRKATTAEARESRLEVVSTKVTDEEEMNPPAAKRKRELWHHGNCTPRMMCGMSWMLSMPILCKFPEL